MSRRKEPMTPPLLQEALLDDANKLGIVRASFEGDRYRASGELLQQKREWALTVVGDIVGAHVHADCRPMLYRMVSRKARTAGPSLGTGKRP